MWKRRLIIVVQRKMKNTILAIVFAPLAALAGAMLGGLIPGNALALVARAAMERGAMSEQTAYILSPCGTFTALGLVAGLFFAVPIRKLIAGTRAQSVALAIGLIAVVAATIGMPSDLRAVTTISFAIGAFANIVRRRTAQQAESTVPSKAAPSASSDVR